MFKSSKDLSNKRKCEKIAARREYAFARVGSRMMARPQSSMASMYFCAPIRAAARLHRMALTNCFDNDELDAAMHFV